MKKDVAHQNRDSSGNSITDRSGRTADRPEEPHSLAFHHAPVGILLVDADSETILDANPHFCTLVGRRFEEIAGKPVEELEFLSARPNGTTVRDALVPPARVGGGELELREQSGRSHRVEISSELHDADGRHYAICIVRRSSKHSKPGHGESEAGYLSLRLDFLDRLPAGCQLIDHEWRYHYINEAAANQGQKSVSELQGHTMMECYPGIEETPLFEALRRSKDERQPLFMRNEFVYSDQSKRTFELSVVPTDAGLFIVSVDQSPRLQMEATTANLAAIVESSDDAIVGKTLDGVITSWNQGAERLYHYSAQEAVGRSISILIPPDHQNELPEILERIARGERVDPYETVRIDKEGRRIDVHLNVSPVLDASGTVIGASAIGRDITEHKAAEARIAEQARLLDDAADAIIVRDTGNRITFWNRGAERHFGWTREEAIGKEANVLLGSPKEKEKLKEAMNLLLEKGEWSGELHPVRKDGRELVALVRWTLIRDERGEPKAFLGVSTDLTEQRTIERQLLRAQRLESLGALAGGIAHDLNNVLAPILMGIEGLRMKESDASSQRIIALIRSSAERGAEVVRQILGFARGVEGDRVEIDLRRLLQEVESITKETFPKAVEIRFEQSGSLLPVTGDSTQIHQVIMNICVNARDAMPEGGRLTVSATNTRLDETYTRMHIDARPISYVIVEITDTGPGMAPGVLENIFDPFFTTKPLGKGTGLGLSTALAIVKGHGGFINVYSEVGKGTSFKIYLPASETTAGRGPDKSEPQMPRGNGELVVVVDDEPPVREIAQQILESYGYRVLTAEDGTEALAVYMREQKSVSAMIIDMMMPNLDGTATIRALRKIDPQLRVIAASGLVSNEQATALQGIRLDAFLTKPFTAGTLLRTLHEVLSPPQRTR